MKRSFDVVVVGGGVMGCSTAYWLSKTKGMKVAVVERDPQYRFASSVLAAGGVRMQFSNEENIRLSKDSLRWLREEGVDEQIMYKERGYLLTAGTEGGAEILRENQALQRSLGAETEVGSAVDARKKFPWLNPEGITACSYGPSHEGWFDPTLLLNVLKDKAKTGGVTFINGEATSTRLEGSTLRTVSVATQQDVVELHVGTAVNACGTRAADFAAQCGWDTHPVAPRKRYVYQVQCPDWVHDYKKGAFYPPMNDSEHKPMPLTVNPNGVWVRPEGVGFICGISPPEDADVLPDDFDVRDDADELFMEMIWPTLAERVAGFESLKLVSTYAGHYEYNKMDQNGIIGLHPSAGNVFYLNGFSGHGLQQSPAAGRAIAELITEGRFTTIDLAKMSPKRFDEGALLFEKNVV